MENFKERFDNEIIKALIVTKEEIQPSAKFIDDLRADSLDMVELVMEFENEFKVSIPDEAVENIVTVQDAEDYLLNMLKTTETPK